MFDGPDVPPLKIAGLRMLALDDHEHRLVISGLKRLRHQLRGDIRKKNRDGWKPAPGKADNDELRLVGVDNLLKRYGTL